MSRIDRRRVLGAGLAGGTATVLGAPAAAEAPGTLFPLAQATIPVQGEARAFPVRRIY